MQIELSRLEVKDILANLAPTVEPEVRAKLTDALGQPFVIGSTHGTPIVRPASSLDELRQTVRAASESAEADLYRPLTRADYPGEVVNEQTGERRYTVSDEEIAIINSQRQTALASEARAKALRAGHSTVDFVEHPTKPPTEHVPIGNKNRYGDTAVQINADGARIFACSNGHTYIDNQTLVAGCPRCFGGDSGGLAATQAEAAVDDEDDDPAVERF